MSQPNLSVGYSIFPLIITIFDPTRAMCWPLCLRGSNTALSRLY